MKTEIRVYKAGEVIFRANFPLDKGPGQIAGALKLAVAKFAQQHPTVSLLEDDVTFKLARAINA
jgi:hypothetical protein